MTASDADAEGAIDVLLEHGCPICGEAAGSVRERRQSALELAPCGHTVFPEDAVHMKAFYRELWFVKLLREHP